MSLNHSGSYHILPVCVCGVVLAGSKVNFHIHRGSRNVQKLKRRSDRIAKNLASVSEYCDNEQPRILSKSRGRS